MKCPEKIVGDSGSGYRGSADSSLINRRSNFAYTNYFERVITSTLRETMLTSMIQHEQRSSYESSMLLPRGWPAERVINPARIAKRVLSLSVLLLCHGFSAKIEVEQQRLVRTIDGTSDRQ